MIATKMSLRLAASLPRVYARPNALARPTVILLSQRTYATPGRPKKAVGEPTKTVKRAVKRVASEKNTTTTTPAAKSTKSKKLPKEKEAKKPKEKKPLTAAQEEKLAEKAAKAQEKVKKAKIKAQEKAKKAEIKELQATALEVPKDVFSSAHTLNAWAIFNGEKTKEAFVAKDGAANSANDPQNVMKVNAQAYKDLSPAELEHYNHLAAQRSAEKQQGYDAWLKTYTPDQIRLANIARRRLRSLIPTKARKYNEIADDRQVKGIRGPYSYFFAHRVLSGDFKNIKATDSSKLIGQEWAALTEGEKQVSHFLPQTYPQTQNR
ncbi:hypothetical protein BDV97DRAFT_343277 [Delphinella strobiligena]|nr:hypothetical protein BDV97DRAFT_343277 [Delphinella strobiligena]